jgi:hypothetical protein
MNHEAWYDEHIAPALVALAGKCLAQGLSFTAAVEYAPGAVAQTVALTKDSCIGIRMVAYCTRTQPNIDSYLIGLRRYMKAQGIDDSASLVFRLMDNKPE